MVDRWRSKCDSIHTNCGEILRSGGMRSLPQYWTFLSFFLSSVSLALAPRESSQIIGMVMVITWPRFSLIKSIVLLRDADNRRCHFYATDRRRTPILLSLPFFPSLSFLIPPLLWTRLLWPPPRSFSSSPPRAPSSYSSFEKFIFLTRQVRANCSAATEIFQCKSSGAISSNFRLSNLGFDWNEKWN